MACTQDAKLDMAVATLREVSKEGRSVMFALPSLIGFGRSGLRYKAMIAVWLIGWMGAWIVLTSTQASAAGYELPKAVGLVMTAMAFAPLVAVGFWRTDWAFWLLGFSVVVGRLPDIPGLPFITEGVDIFVLVVAVHALRNIGSLRSRIHELPHACLAIYVFSGVLSMMVAQAFGSAGAWELKVGISALIIYLGFYLSSVYAAFPDNGHPSVAALRNVLDGLVWAALLQLALSTLAVGLSFSGWVSPDNRSLWGLGYFMRVSSLFAGPDQAAMFFVATLPILLWWLKGREPGRVRTLGAIYIQAMPWFLACTGSRGARLALIGVVAILLLRPVSRRQAINVVPSILLSYWIAFYYQSFPDAVSDLVKVWAQRLRFSKVGQLDMSGSSLKGRLLEDQDRVAMLQHAWQSFVSEPWLNKLIGYGPGVSGFSSQGYPTTHSQLQTVFDTGLLGIAVIATFIITIVYRLMRDQKNDLSYFLVASVAALLVSGLTYEVMMWGTSLVILSLAAAVPFLKVPLVPASPAIDLPSETLQKTWARNTESVA